MGILGRIRSALDGLDTSNVDYVDQEEQRKSPIVDYQDTSRDAVLARNQTVTDAQAQVEAARVRINQEFGEAK